MKYFVLDTNVLLHNSQSMFAFGKNRVIIPLPVIEELDKFKTFTDEKGRHAREVARQLDKLRQKGKLYEGVPLENGGVLQVVPVDKICVPPGLDPSRKDNQILATALAELQRDPKQYVCFVTKDLNARIKADAMGIHSEDFESDKITIEELPTGWIKQEVPEATLAAMERDGSLPKDDFVALCPKETDVYHNLFVELSGAKRKEPLLCRYDDEAKRLMVLRDAPDPWGIRPLNSEQRFALELLLDERVSLVTLVGTAGTGKTLLAIAAGLQTTIDERIYRRMLVSRPIMPLGRDIGYLPGSKDEKLSHWMLPIFDNLEFIFNRHLDSEVNAEEQLLYLLESKKIELEALTYIRGRSIPQQYLVIDESQNLTPHEVKTIISRAGDGTKVVLTGDPYQIDNPYLDSSSNGLATVVARFKGQRVFGHVTLIKSERSFLSSLAVGLL